MFNQGEDGMGAAPAAGGFEFGVNPDDDPELALALRVSMEEQRARQQAEGGAPDTPGGGAVAAPGAAEETSEVGPKLHSLLKILHDLTFYSRRRCCSAPWP